MQQNRNSIDWALFAGLTALWASAYAFTRLAVSHDDPALGFPPQFIIPMRITAGALVLLIVVAISRQSWPPFSDWKSWLIMAAMGTLGTAAPFLLITTAQKTVDSSLAALYVSAAPLFTSVLAHMAFHDDYIDRRKALGLIIGFLGVAVLFGPEAIASFGSASVVAQAMCLAATFFYASSSIIARYGRNIPPFVFSAGFLMFGSIATWPLLFFVDFEILTPSSGAIAGLVGLALGPTAIASVLYMLLIQRTSATFVSLTGYMIPILSAIIGYLAFRETQSWNAFLAFALILGGVWLAQRQQKAGLPPKV
ncbi:MAG: DMT family transporter [Alphaproteobacteria bacterium]|nr:DMT family transporter [Alphaproteobacteria bacterium]